MAQGRTRSNLASSHDYRPESRNDPPAQQYAEASSSSSTRRPRPHQRRGTGQRKLYPREDLSSVCRRCAYGRTVRCTPLTCRASESDARLGGGICGPGGSSPLEREVLEAWRGLRSYWYASLRPSSSIGEETRTSWTEPMYSVNKCCRMIVLYTPASDSNYSLGGSRMEPTLAMMIIGRLRCLVHEFATVVRKCWPNFP